MGYRRCTLKKSGHEATGNRNSRAARRPKPPTNEEGEVQLPFDRLDEPAISWKGDTQSHEAYLLSPNETKRRRRDIAIVLANPAYRELAIRQLKVGLDMLRRWERKEPQKFQRKNNQFVIERVIAELHLWARMTTKSAWPELFQVIAEYHRLKERTASLRLCLISQAAASANEA